MAGVKRGRGNLGARGRKETKAFSLARPNSPFPFPFYRLTRRLAAESQTFLRAKRPQRRRARTNRCFSQARLPASSKVFWKASLNLLKEHQTAFIPIHTRHFFGPFNRAIRIGSPSTYYIRTEKYSPIVYVSNRGYYMGARRY